MNHIFGNGEAQPYDENKEELVFVPHKKVELFSNCCGVSTNSWILLESKVCQKCFEHCEYVGEDEQ